MHSRCGCYNAQPPTCDVALGLLGLSAWSLNLAAEPKLLYATVIVICRAAEQVLQTPTRCQTPHCFVDRQQRHGASAFATTPLRSFAGCSRHLPGRRLGTLRAWLRSHSAAPCRYNGWGAVRRAQAVVCMPLCVISPSLQKTRAKKHQQA
jgi:hypothetical protein